MAVQEVTVWHNNVEVDVTAAPRLWNTLVDIDSGIIRALCSVLDFLNELPSTEVLNEYAVRIIYTGYDSNRIELFLGELDNKPHLLSSPFSIVADMLPVGIEESKKLQLVGIEKVVLASAITVGRDGWVSLEQVLEDAQVVGVYGSRSYLLGRINEHIMHKRLEERRNPFREIRLAQELSREP